MSSERVRIIGGQWKRTPLPVLDAPGLRPTPDRVRETLFNWLGQRLDGWVCLDLFAGTGALGFEAASRGAASVLLIEQHPPLIAQLEAIRSKLDAQTTTIRRADALSEARRLAAHAPGSFDLVFLDPPYRSGWLPRIVPLTLPLLRPQGLLYIEAEAPLDVLLGEMLHRQEVFIERQAKAGQVHYYLLRHNNEQPGQPWSQQSIQAPSIR